MPDQYKPSHDTTVSGRHYAPSAPKPQDVPLGTGMANQAKEVLQNRKSQIDKAIEDAGG